MENNETFAANIAISNSDCFSIGDKVVFYSIEIRWWKKIINFILRKPSETKSKLFTITEKSEGEVEIYPAIMENA